MGVNLYDEMNYKIASLLRLSDSPVNLYAAAYIEQLQAENAELRRGREGFYRIGIDMAGKEAPDQSVVIAMCSQCNSILVQEMLWPGERRVAKLPKVCSYCKSKLSGPDRLQSPADEGGMGDAD